MGKRILRVYLAKNDTPYSAAYAKLELPASPWEVWDAMEKVRLQTDDILYMGIEDYFAFEYLSPHLDGLDISLNELNDLAAQLAALDEVQGIAFEGMFSIAVQKKVNANGGVITLQDLRDLAVSAKTDCYHVVDAADDAALGQFYAENDFVPELDGVSDAVFKMLDFAGIGRMMRCSENGVFVGSLYVLQDGELTTAPPVQKILPEKPGYLFRLTLGLHPDIGDDRTVTLMNSDISSIGRWESLRSMSSYIWRRHRTPGCGITPKPTPENTSQTALTTGSHTAAAKNAWKPFGMPRRRPGPTLRHWRKTTGEADNPTISGAVVNCAVPSVSAPHSRRSIPPASGPHRRTESRRRYRRPLAVP